MNASPSLKPKRLSDIGSLASCQDVRVSSILTSRTIPEDSRVEYGRLVRGRAVRQNRTANRIAGVIGCMTVFQTVGEGSNPSHCTLFLVKRKHGGLQTRYARVRFSQRSPEVFRGQGGRMKTTDWGHLPPSGLPCSSLMKGYPQEDTCKVRYNLL